MYHYIYDNFLSDKRQAKTLAELENRLTDLGIQGRVDRLHPFKSLREAIDEGLRRGTKTLVAVGNDETFKKILDVAAGMGVTVGYVPLAPESAFAELLGIPLGVAACDILAARLTEKLDVGRVNGQYFLAAVSFDAKNVKLECEGRFRLELVAGGRVSIMNIAAVERDAPEHVANPFDGLLEAVLEPAAAGPRPFRGRAVPSVLPIKRVVARSPEAFSLYSDGRELKSQNAEIDLAKEKLKVIIGKSRLFAAMAGGG